MKEGICLIYNPHSTAVLAISPLWDPAGFMDLDEEIRRLIPTDGPRKREFFVKIQSDAV